MGNRPCVKCGATTWWWSDPLVGCNLCVSPDADPANLAAFAITGTAIATGGLANMPSQVSVPVAPVWNGDPLQGLRCQCTHTLATHSPRSRACLLPTCPCLQYVASEVYVPRPDR